MPSEKHLALFRTTTGFLLGVMVFLSFGVAPVLFHHYPSAEAGAIMGKLFPVYYHTIYGLVFVALILLLLMRKNTNRFWPVFALLLFSAVFIASNEFQLGPAMNRVRDIPGREIFRKLHGFSMILNLLSMCAVLLSIFLIGPHRECKPHDGQNAQRGNPD